MLIRCLFVAALVAALAATDAGAEQAAGGLTLRSGPYREYRQWARMNATPIFSATHGNSFVVTYINPRGLPAAHEGAFPFPAGTVIVKEAFENRGCKPGQPGAVFVMEKREEGFDRTASDWLWVRYNPDGTLWGEGKSGGQMDFCAACHSVARVNDYVFGNGTTIKVTPTMPLTSCQPE